MISPTPRDPLERCTEDEENKAHDLSGKRVLVPETFAYFGVKARRLPSKLQCLVVTRGHRSKFSDEVKSEFIRFTRAYRSASMAHPINGQTAMILG